MLTVARVVLSVRSTPFGLDRRCRHRRAGDRLLLFVDVRGCLLWRVRRKLMLSYIFIGVVPVAADIVLLRARAGCCCSSTSAPICSNARSTSVVDGARCSRRALRRRRAVDPATSRRRSSARQSGGGEVSAASRYVAGADRQSLRPAATRRRAPRQTAGRRALELTSAQPRASLPAWVPCDGFAGARSPTSAGAGGDAARAARVAWPRLPVRGDRRRAVRRCGAA